MKWLKYLFNEMICKKIEFHSDKQDIKKKKSIKFLDVREEILVKLNKNSEFIFIDESLSLLEGFIQLRIDQNISHEMSLLGNTLPMIIFLGNETGQLYHFAFFALFPEMK